jgi:DNA-binding MarR family transcriptional regulator
MWNLCADGCLRQSHPGDQARIALESLPPEASRCLPAEPEYPRTPELLLAGALVCTSIFIMKTFGDEMDRDDSDPATGAARVCVETGVRLARLIRRAVREAPGSALSPSRLRALAFLDDNPHACLTDLAEHLIVGAPTASKLVDDLVARRFLSRASDVRDRRRLAMRMTAAGRRALRTAARPAQDRLAELLGKLPKREIARVRAGMEALLPLLVAERAEVSEVSDA